MRFDVNSIIWKNGKSRDVLHQRQVRRAQGQRQIWRQGALDPKFPRQINHVLHPDMLQQPHRRHIARVRQCSS
jgi:hypothetical protein